MVASFNPSRLIACVVRGHVDFVEKAGAQSFDGSNGCQVSRIAGDDDARIKGTDKRSNGAACLERKAMSPKRFGDHKADVPDVKVNVIGLADFEVDMSRVLIAGRQNAKMIKGREPTRSVLRNDVDKF